METLEIVAEEIDVPERLGGPKKYFKKLFTHMDSDLMKGYIVLDVAPVTKHEIYLAIEESDLETHAADRRVFARLCLAVQAEDGTVTKYWTEDEHEPPALTNCPLRILNLLTPTTETNALLWRLRCYEKQIEEARTMYDKTKARYEATHFDSFRDYVRKSAGMMVERRFLILHQALSAEQMTRALLKQQEQQR